MKLYMHKEGYDECCNDIDYFKDEISDGAEKVELELMVRDKGNYDNMWCKDEGEPVLSDEHCGKRNCTKYSPRNGKSGCCRHLVSGYTGSGQYFVLTKKGLKKLS